MVSGEDSAVRGMSPGPLFRSGVCTGTLCRFNGVPGLVERKDVFTVLMRSKFQWRSFTERRAALWLGLVLVVSLTGCPGGTPAPAPGTTPVSGKVIRDGEPLPIGDIIFFNDSGAEKSVRLGGDGAYSIAEGLPVGDYKVIVRVTPEASAGAGTAPPVPMEELPAKYSDRKATELTAKVEPGKTSYDFTLTTK